MVFASISIPNFNMWQRSRFTREMGMAVLPDRVVLIFVFFVSVFGGFRSVGVLVTVQYHFFGF